MESITPGCVVKNESMKIIEEFKETSFKELWVEGVLYNFIFGFLGASIVVAITLRLDVAVLMSYLAYYFFVGKVINRPKYVTSLGKFIVFPIPTAVGAFIGYKVSPILILMSQ